MRVQPFRSASKAILHKRRAWPGRLAADRLNQAIQTITHSPYPGVGVLIVCFTHFPYTGVGVLIVCFTHFPYPGVGVS